jgi:hypothetical protein
VWEAFYEDAVCPTFRSDLAHAYFEAMAMVAQAADLLPSLQLCASKLGELGAGKLRAETGFMR